MEQFVGAKILAFVISDSHETILMQTDKGLGILNAVGDCCSSTWFENITGVQDVIGGVIAKFGNYEFQYPDSYKIIENHPKLDGLQYYSSKIVTDKGTLELEFRNSSNGYYGGHLEGSFIDDSLVSDLRDREGFKINFKPLERDF